MPVLITITTLTFLFGGGAKVSFLDPAALREQCKEKLVESDVLDQALRLTDELEELARRYEEAAAASLDAYLAESEKHDTWANDLIGQLEPFDRTRAQALQEILQVRQSMLEILTVEEWEQIFG